MSFLSFAAEQGPFPFVHVVVPAALYFCSRWLLLALYLLYVFESLELSGSHVFAVLAETPEDSLIGDIIQGSLSIVNLFLIDQIFGFDGAVVRVVPWWERFILFSVIGLGSPLAAVCNTTDGNFGVLIFLAFYLGAAAVIVGSHLFGAPQTSDEKRAARSISLWLSLVCLYAIVATPVTTSALFSVWMRMFVLSALICCGAAATLIVRLHRASEQRLK